MFGVTEGTTRTALSRMVAAHELAAADGSYELIGELRARRSRQALSRSAERRPWDGTWTLAVVAPGARTPRDRAAFREAGRRLRLVEWREGLWCRPDNLDADRLADSRAVLAAQSTWVTRRDPDAPPVDLFAAGAWAADAERLIAEMTRLEPALSSADREALERGFLLSADVIRHFGSDPLLPDELVDDWPGDALRRSFDRHEVVFKRAHRSWFKVT